VRHVNEGRCTAAKQTDERNRKHTPIASDERITALRPRLPDATAAGREEGVVNGIQLLAHEIIK